MGMCGGGSDKALKAQQQADAAKQAQIAAGTRAVDAAFNTPQREADINAFQNATQGLLRQSLDKQQVQANLQNKFALARNGQIGGSVAVDRNKMLADDYNNGILKITQASKQAGARVRAADQSTQQNLLGLVQSGLDSGSAATQALTGMKSSLAAEKAAIDPSLVGDVFGGLGDFYTTSQQTKAYNDANKATGALYGNPAAYRTPY